MNKRVFLSVMVLLSFSFASGANVDTLAVSRPSEHWFIGAGGGIQGMTNLTRNYSLSSGNAVTPGYEFQLGKWITPQFGVRLGFHGGPLGHNAVRFNNYYVHGDLLLNLLNPKYSSGFSIVPYGHFGLITEVLPNKGKDHEYGAGAGLMLSKTIVGGLSAYIDGRISLLNSNASQGLGIATANSLSAGLMYDFSGSSWRNAASGDLACDSFWKNWMVTVGGGVNFLNEINFRKITLNGIVTPAYDITLGKWFSPAIGVRAGVQGLRYGRMNISDFGFVYPHADLLWNISNTIHSSDLNRVWNLVPYVHVGAIHEYRTDNLATIDNDYAAGVGLLNLIRMGRQIGLFVDFRSMLLTASASAGGYHSLGLSAIGGVFFDINRPGWKLKGQYYSEPYDNSAADEKYVLGRFWDQWFISIAGGANISMDLHRSYLQPLSMPDLASEIGIGKWFSPAFGVRGAYQGLSYGMSNDRAGMGYVHADLLWNFSRSITNNRPHAWEVVPYMHFGGFWEWYMSDPQKKTIERELASGPGIMNLFRLSENAAITADFRLMLLTPRACLDKGINYGALGTALIGLQLGFDKPDWYKGGKGYLASNFFEHWFAGISAGVQYNGGFQPALDLTLGKWFAPYWGARGGWQGLGIKGRTSSAYVYNYIHGDFLLNTMPGKRVQLIPYIHMGWVNETLRGGKADVKRDFAAGAGLLTAIRINEHLDVTADLRATVLKGKLSVEAGRGASIAATGLIGLNYYPGEREFAVSDSEGPSREEKRNWAISTNLFDIVDVGTLGLDFQYAVARHWTVDAQFKFNPWNFHESLYDRSQTYSVGARWWPWYVYSGFWLKGKAQVQRYEREGIFMKNSGAGEAVGAGLQAGYSLMLCSWLNLDMGVGAWGGRQEPHISSGQWFVEPEIEAGLQFVF